MENLKKASDISIHFFGKPDRLVVKTSPVPSDLSGTILDKASGVSGKNFKKNPVMFLVIVWIKPDRLVVNFLPKKTSDLSGTILDKASDVSGKIYKNPFMLQWVTYISQQRVYKSARV